MSAQPRARHRHHRRPRAPGSEGPGDGRDGRRDRDRDPGLLLRAAARAAGRRLPHVPVRGRGAAEAPGRLHADGHGRPRPQDRRDEREGGRGPERDPRVHPPQPPARLPGLRQGRRVPAPGPDLPLRPRLDAHALPEADVRQADPDLAADRARPRALHPLLPLHPLLRERLRGRPARGRQPRRLVDDRDLRGRALPRALLRQRRRALPRRRAHLDDLPLPRAAVGDPERAHRLRALPGRLQRLGDDARGQGGARSSPATTRRSTRAGSATRAASPTTTCAPTDRIRAPLVRVRRRGFEEVSVRGGARRGRDRASRGRLGSVVVAFSGRRDRRAGDRARAHRPRGPRLRRGAPARTTGRPGLAAFRAPLSAIRDADVCLVLGDDPVVERAPVVDLWLRAARRRRGATSIAVNPAGDVQVAPGSAPQVCAALREGGKPPTELRRRRSAVRGADARRARLVGGRPDRRPPRRRARQRPARERPARRSPSTPCRARPTAAASPPPGTPSARAVPTRRRRARSARSIVSGDEAGADPRVAELAGRARFVLTTAMFQSDLTAWSHVVLPGTSYLEREGTFVNLEGRRAAAPPGRRPERARRARVARRGSASASASPIDPWAAPGRGEQAELRARRRVRLVAARPAGADRQGRPGPGSSSSATGRSSAAPPSSASRSSSSSGPRRRGRARPRGRGRRAGSHAGETVRVSSNGTTKELRARLSRRLRDRRRRGSPAEHAEGLADRVQVEKAGA